MNDQHNADQCPRCGAPVERTEPELLKLEDIMQRYKVGRTKALDPRRAVRRIEPGAVLRHGKCVRVLASAVDRVWGRG